VYGIVNGEVSIKEIRDVTVEDLLPRDEISLSIEEISGYLKGETILVTGGGGSIGSELCRQIASYEPKTLLVLIYTKIMLTSFKMNLCKNIKAIWISK